MIRTLLVLAVLTTGLSVAGCAASHPATAPDTLTQRTNELLRSVDPNANVAFQGKTCGSAFDQNADSHTIFDVETTVSGDPTKLVETLRAAAVRTGWQPQVPGEFALGLTGTDGTDQIMVGVHKRDNRIEVLVESASCSVSGNEKLSFSKPELQPGQRSALELMAQTISQTAIRVLGTFGISADPKYFPASGKLADAPGLGPDNCRAAGTTLGAQLINATSTDTKLPGTDIEDAAQRAAQAFGPGWQVSGRGPNDVKDLRNVTATTGTPSGAKVQLGVQLRLHSDNTLWMHLTVDATTCLPPNS